MADSWVHLEVERVERETDKALLVVLAEDTGECDAGEKVWIPRTQMADPDDYQAGDGPCTISVKQWLAREKGLE